MSHKTEKTQKKPRTKLTYTSKPLPTEGVIRLPSIISALGISKTSFLDGVKANKYPAGILLSPRCRVWPVAQIRALLTELEKGGAE